MNKRLLIFIILIFSSIQLFADKIYLKDSEIIEGKIIQITESRIEYNPAGDKPFLTIPREDVEKVIYDNGQVEQIAPKEKVDKIILNDGIVIQCNIQKMTSHDIIYNAINSDRQNSLDRNSVNKVIFKDGTTVEFSRAEIQQTGTENDENYEIEEEYEIRSGGFIDSWVWAGVFAGDNSTSGGINDLENEIYDEYGFEEYEIENSSIYSGYNLEIMFPAIKFVQKRGFDLTGLKFGIKSAYLYHNMDQLADIEGASSKVNILDYRTINLGPELNIVFSPRNDIFNMVVQLYSLYGYIHRGELRAAPALREIGYEMDKEEYYSKVGGFSLVSGAGLHFVLNRIIPVTIGLNIQFSTTRIILKNDVPFYDNAENVDFDENGFNISAGIHI